MPEKCLATIALLDNQGRLPRGQVGTVLKVLDDEHLLVEFAGLDGVAFAIESVLAAKVLELRHAPPYVGNDGLSRPAKNGSP